MEASFFWTLENWACVQLEWEAPLLFGLENKLSQCLEKGLSTELATGLRESLVKKQTFESAFQKSVH